MATLRELEHKRDELRKKLDSGVDKYDALENYNPAKQEGDTRQQIATTFVAGYFGIFILILIGVPLYNGIVSDSPPIIDLEGALQLFGTIIGTSLGFVVGYYFKSQNNN